jgi:hypothetical protein
MKHIVRIDADTDIGQGFEMAAEQVAADVPEQSARKLVKRMAQLIYMQEYIKQTGHATEQDKRDLAIFQECFAHAELPNLSIILSTPSK